MAYRLDALISRLIAEISRIQIWRSLCSISSTSWSGQWK